MGKIYISLLLILGLSSCSTGLRIEKRHYRSGYYLSSSHHSNRVPMEEGARIVLSTSHQVAEAEQDCTASVASAPIQEHVNAPADVVQPHRADDLLPVTLHEIPRPVIAPQENKQHQVNSPPYEGPVEAKSLSVMLWIAFIALLLGIISIIMAFAPAVGSAAVFGVAAPFLILGALVLGYIVATKARRKRDAYAQSDPETGRFYNTLRFKALLVAGIATGIVVVFTLLLALVIAALSSW